MTTENPLGLRGIDFVEVTAEHTDWLESLLHAFGFSALRARPGVRLFRQNDIRFLVTDSDTLFAAGFRAAHGPSICSMGWRVDDADAAFEEAVRRGAKPYTGSNGAVPGKAIYGIGDSLIHFVDSWGEGGLLDQVFEPLDNPVIVPSKGFTVIDHLTNNVVKGTLQKWADFYKQVFGFTEVRYFDIRGVQTGLTSYALRSPDGSFCIPINEGSEEKSQIEEYLREYQGPGVQHLAFLTDDLLASLDALDGSDIETLDIDDQYYAEVFDRVPGITENPERIQRHQVLVDGDEAGYLLQIFTKNLIGPIFIELIQRKNHHAFGEGNFGALFRSIERDQAKRGVL